MLPRRALPALTSAALFVVVLAGPAAAPAGAAVNCLRTEDGITGFSQVFVTLSAPGEAATVRRSGTAITVNGAACGDATTTNVDRITVTGSIEAHTIAFDLGGGPFAPGLTPEEAGTSEIELVVDADAWDTVEFDGSAGADRLTAGAGGVALNTDGDVDVTFGGLPNRVWFSGGAGADRLSGMGGFGTGAPWARSAGVNMNGDDGDDLLFPSRTPSEYVMGSAGIDTVSYVGRTAKVTVVLADAAFDDGQSGDLDMVRKDVENLVGTAFDDSLTGNLFANRILGGAGADRVVGLGGSDELYGQDGADVLIARDSVRDHVYGGNQFDAARIDGVDVTSLVERFVP